MPEPIKLEALSVAIAELSVAWTRKHDATEDYKETCKSVAEQSGLEESVVRAYINARMSDKVEASKRKVEQLELCFDGVA